MKKMTSTAKYYIVLHVIITILIYSKVISGHHGLSYSFILPFIVFGSFFEFFRLNAFTINNEEFDMSAGAAIILAAILLFNPFELIVFATCYGFSIVIFPRVTNLVKAVFNICETINVTYFSYLVWNMLHQGDSLLVLDNIIPLLATMFFFVIIDLMAVSLMVALASETNLFKLWRDSLDWVIVSYGLIAFIGLILAAVYQAFYLYGLIGFAIPLLLMRYNMHLFSKEKDLQVTQLEEFNTLLKENNDHLILTLSQIIDIRDNSLFGHSTAVAKYAEAIGTKLYLSQEQMYDLRRGSLLHDIGKLGISENILQKPGRLTDEEFTVIKNHTLIGEKILQTIKGLENISPIVCQHHEYYNGLGYPYKIHGDHILIQSRIVSLCDALDTMLSDRSYKKGCSLEEAVAEILRCRGSQFDPQVVDGFLEVLNEKGDGFFVNSAKTENDSSFLKNLLKI